MLVIGVGNDFRSDDALGLVVVRALAEMNIPGVRVVESTGEGARLMELFGEDDEVILIDAILSDTTLPGASPGAVQQFDAHLHPLPTRFSLHSSHAFSVAEAIEVARVLQRLPSYLLVCGIEGESFGYGEELSPSLERALPAIIAQISRLVQSRV